jgi:hypothetical protein
VVHYICTLRVVENDGGGGGEAGVGGSIPELLPTCDTQHTELTAGREL